MKDIAIYVYVRFYLKQVRFWVIPITLLMAFVFIALDQVLYDSDKISVVITDKGSKNTITGNSEFFVFTDKKTGINGSVRNSSSPIRIGDMVVVMRKKSKLLGRISYELYAPSQLDP